MDTPYPSSAVRSETVDELFALLAHEKYRHVIQYFQQTSDSVTTLDRLVSYSVQQTDDNINREKRAIALHHVALPRLAETSVLDYDTRQNTIRYRGWPAAERLVQQLHKLEAT